MVAQITTVPSSTALRLGQVFATVDAACCPKRINLHLHTVYSDGRMRPEEVIDQAIALGVEHISITDHHTVDGYLLAQKYLSSCTAQTKPILWAGVEINASLLFTEVHLLGYGFDPHHKAMRPYLQSKTTAGVDYQAVSVTQAIHQAGGLVVLAHPARYRRRPAELITAAVPLGIDGVETYYGYENHDPWRPSSHQSEQIHALGQKFGLFHSCGTDSHGFKITRRL
ncbi:MAG: PHP domain-containing protein [Oscillatoriales cyanobacterium SM2_2_1]|nr:PHP domain-containing protein [Oscillatoriales cyanobacterium SM2_2_1]